MQQLRGRVAVVTGAASGIGLGMAERFAAEGMRLVMADVEASALASAADQLRSSGAEVVSVACDVSRHEDVAALASRALDAFGAVHLVCNNAGVADTSGAPVWERNRPAGAEKKAARSRTRAPSRCSIVCGRASRSGHRPVRSPRVWSTRFGRIGSTCCRTRR